ncbi:MAG TPA: transcriptional initiation protein Tat, partial [Bacteroidota bacterium]|nr:transcriptional initiation protein Tat [Bacteroidota bacterium]
PLLLRVPAWCAAAGITINGKSVELTTTKLRWVELRRTWNKGDIVRLTLPMQIRVKTWERNNNAVSVYRGPLAYSLNIGERWSKYAGTDAWPCYEVFPTTPWNFGLELDRTNQAESFTVIQRKGSNAAQPFTPDAAPILLETKGRRIPGWKLESNGMTGLLQESPVRTKAPAETITLIPMGCARLRISAFPVIGDGPDAHTWR